MRHDTGNDASENEPSVVMSEQALLGQSLREKRDELGIGLDEIVRTTKIPKASLLNIESGQFDKLPGDVFARGFLRSYARCVGLDGDEVVQRYAQCGLNPAPVSSPLADSLSASLSGPRERRHARGSKSSRKAAETERKPSVTKQQVVRNVLRDAFDLRGRRAVDSGGDEGDNSAKASENTSESQDKVVGQKTQQKRVRTFLPPSFDSQDDMTHRGPLTLGVIILVIVATLTMSYLLRRPGTNTDGFTMNAPTTSQTQAS